MSEAEGRRFGPFTILGPLARGGQGAVLRARDERTGAPAALKLLLGAEEKGVRRFRQEAQVLARLAHPSIVRVIDHGVEQGAPFLAMELVDGETLGALVTRARTARTPLPGPWVARALASIADALEACHATGIVHRDLKPENILVERGTGRPVLVDFGLLRRDADVFGALSIDARSRLSQTGELRGTPAYMAPEQATPTRFGPVSPRTDVYGLGAVLYFALTGGAPFSAPSIAQLIYQILEDPPPAPRAAGLDERLAAIALAALRKRPEERPASAAALAAALRVVGGPGPPGPPPVAAEPPASRPPGARGGPPPPGASPPQQGAPPSQGAPRPAVADPRVEPPFAPGEHVAPPRGTSDRARAAAEPFPFEVLRQLGEGGMGAVYEVRRAGDPRRLAAKFLTSPTAEARARFQREGELVARLDHPGVVPVIGAGLRDGAPYLVFELVAGRSLRDLLAAEGRLPEPRVLDLGEQLARALGHAHARGVVHRDVKPDNLLIEDGTGRLRVADFGIALAADQERLTRTGQVTGTVLYMAREQLGEGEVGPWTDVWAAGSVLFEALCGRRPFEGESATSVIAAIVTAEAPLVRELRPDASVGLEAIIERCLEKDGARRYPDGDALADALAALRSGAGSSSATLLASAGRRLRRRLSPGACAGLVAGAALLGGGGWYLRERAAQAETRRLLELAADLDGLHKQLEQSGASDKVLERVSLGVAEARVALEGGARAGRAERERLALALGALERRRDVALALRAAELALRAPVEPARLARALADLERVPAGEGGHDLEEARARVAFAAGRLDVARDALARIAPDPAPRAATAAGARDDLDAWLADPAARRAWLRAWVELRQGDEPSASARVAAGPPALRGLLLVVAAGAAPDATVAGATLERARAALGRARGPEGALVEALARVEALRRWPDATHAATREALLELRRLSDPSGPARVPADVQAAASVVEGDLLLRLGWWAGAAEAFARALRAPSPGLLLPAAPQALAAGGGGPCALLAPDAAARLGLARALALRLDGPAALAAARDAAARLAHDQPPAALERARTLEREALALEGAAGLEGAPGASAGPSASRDDLPPRGLALDGRLDAAALLTAEAACELAALRRAPPPAPDARARGLARARRGLLLARRLAAAPADDRAAGERAALLSLVLLEQGDATASRAALDEAARRDAAGWRTREARARWLLAHGPPGEACRALEEALEAPDLRILERGERALRLLRGAADALRARGHEVDALRARDLEARCAERDRWTFTARGELLDVLEREARALGPRGERVLEGLPARREALARVEAQTRPHAAIMSRALRELDELQQSPELTEALSALIAATPREVELYTTNHVLQGRMQASGFDSLALGFEVGPRRVLEYFNDGSFSARGHSESERDVLRSGLRPILEGGEPEPTLPLRRDDDLRDALAGLYALDLGLPPDAPLLESAARAALRLVVRRPESPCASLAHGRLRLGLGDAAGALEWMVLAREVATTPGGTPSPWLSMHEAMAQGALRRWPESKAALERAAADGLRHGYRIREEPSFWEDRELPGTLAAGPAEVAAALEQLHGKFELGERQR